MLSFPGTPGASFFSFFPITNVPRWYFTAGKYVFLMDSAGSNPDASSSFDYMNRTSVFQMHMAM